MNQKIIDHCKNYLHESFFNITEDSGGYNYRIEHSLRVYETVRFFLERIKTEKFSASQILIGALFHDLGKKSAINNGKIDYAHSASLNDTDYAKFYVQEALQNMVSQECIDNINMIICSLKKPNCNEVKLICDADNLDEYGIKVLWRSIGFAYHSKNDFKQVFTFWKEHKSKAQAKINSFYFDFTRDIAQKRLRHFLNTLESIKQEYYLYDLS